MSSNYWLIAVPNESKDASATFNQLNKNTSALGFSRNWEWPIPLLKVGTLDSLMALSDDLQKYDTQVGQIAKKIERTYKDMARAEQDEEEKNNVNKNNPNNNNNSANKTKQQQPKAETMADLKVNGMSAEEYITKFQWNEVRYPKRSPLRGITDLITKEAAKQDESLKKQIADYNEVRTAYTAIERKDTGTLLVKPLGPYVKPNDIIEKGHLTTILVVVPKSKALEFEQNYELMEDQHKLKEEEEQARKEKERLEKEERDKIEKDKQAEKDKDKPIQHSNQNKQQSKSHELKSHEESKEEDDHEEKHSNELDHEHAIQPEPNNDQSHHNNPPQPVKPLTCKIVVPRSAKKLVDENSGDEFVLYRVVVIREGADLFKSLCRERRYTVRPFALNQTEENEEKEKKAEFAKKKRNLWSYLLRWCATSYSEMFAAWIHIKAIRLYVEAVLRYGLPVNFSAFVLEPQKGKDKQLRQQLKVLYGKLAGSNANLTTTLDANEVDLSGFGADFYPYVYLPLSLTE